MGCPPAINRRILRLLLAYVSARLVRRFPPACIGNVIAVNTMNACDVRVFIEAAAIALCDVQRALLGFGRPRNNAANVVSFWAVNADA